MSDRLVGREAESELLGEPLERARGGAGSLVLVAGEAGIGKTRLVREVGESAGVPLLWGRASQGAATPYAPVVAALRSHLRADPGAFDDVGPLRAHLALLLPELGEGTAATDRATLVEAIRCALVRVADEPAMVVLDDLHWSDDATLELLPALAETLDDVPVVLVGVYRSDGLPREHALRGVRNALRRGRRLVEVSISPLDADGIADLLEEALGGRPAPSLARTIHDRTQGVPFFAEELAEALHRTGALTEGPRGLELAGRDVPIPDTVRDAVLASIGDLSEPGRSAATAAAVAGDQFDAELVARLSADAGVAELIGRGIVVEGADGSVSFRHALTQEAIYADVPWLERRSLHRTLAGELEEAGAPPAEIAAHWLGAREESRARDWLVRAAAESRAMHAYRDAVRAGRQALDLWPEEQEDERRLEALESYAAAAELCGQLGEAARAWREVCAHPLDDGRLAAAHGRLGRVHDLQGNRDAALAERSRAAELFAGAGRLADAATQRLVVGNYLRASANYGEAVDVARSAGEEARGAGRTDLVLRARGLEGVALAKGEDPERGRGVVREALAEALEADMTAVAADLYQRLSLVLYDAADYGQAQDTLDSALELCRTADEPGTEVACVTCMVYVLRERGEWDEALRMARELIDAGTAVWVAEGLVGSIYAHQGKLSSARRLLSSAHATATRIDHFNMSVDSTTGLARVAALQGLDEEAADRSRNLIAHWQGSEDHHYCVKGLRWSAGFFARRGDLQAANKCAEALTSISSRSGHADALAALAYAIGETALADGDAATASAQLEQALELHAGLDLPLERAEIELRSGVALAAAGEREAALERLGGAYRAARGLGARTLAAEAANEVSELGESVGRRLGRKAVADRDAEGLTPRELEVLRLVAVGRTNREVAEELVVSTRTVDMHVRNVLRKLDCRSRVEAAHRAGELGLLA